MSTPVHLSPQAVDSHEPGGSQAVKAQLRLREMILAGELPSGERITELAIVEKLGVSRTPIRAALMRLEQEGLLEALANGGYAVRIFSERDVSEAIELRGTLEGLSARLAAERGANAGALLEADACLREIDEVLARVALDDETFSRYVTLNQRFASAKAPAPRPSCVSMPALHGATCARSWMAMIRGACRACS